MRKLLQRVAAKVGVALGDRTLWTTDDYLLGAEPPPVQDFWVPPVDRSDSRSSAENSACLEARSIPDMSVHQASDVEREATLAEPPSPGLFDWFSDEPFTDPGHDATFDAITPDLPFFDPGATEALPVAPLFDRPHRFRPDTLAGLLARETAIQSLSDRRRAADTFADALDSGRWPKLYQSWLKLAPAVHCSGVLALAFELRELWEDSPHLWLYRSGIGRLPGQHASAQQHMSWRRALAMAAFSPDETAWRLIDEDLIDDWRELGEPCPGYWSLAEYFELRLTADEAGTHLSGLFRLQERAKRSLHVQEDCGHLDVRPGGRSFRIGVGPVIDPQIAGFDRRAGHLGRDLRARPTEPRSPTPREMRVADIDAGPAA